MRFSLSASDPLTNIVVTVGVALLVILLPVFDRLISKKLRLDLAPGAGVDTRERRLLRLREALLLFIFLCYVAVTAYIVFFSRVATQDYRIHVHLFSDLHQSVRIDSGFLGLLSTIFTKGFAHGFSQIHIDNPTDLAQVYLNVLLFIPLGYLLPYCFRWFRDGAKYRPVLAGFLCSLAIENLQLVTKRGFYDIDDLAANTIGALIGQLLFLALAYTVTHPDWKRDLADSRRFRHYARRHTLFPFAKKSTSARITLLCRDAATAREFYSLRLGFRPIGMQDATDTAPESFLFAMGNMQLEILCVGDGHVPEGQRLTFRVRNLDRARKQLLKHDVAVSDFCRDPYGDLRYITFAGPGVTVYILG